MNAIQIAARRASTLFDENGWVWRQRGGAQVRAFVPDEVDLGDVFTRLDEDTEASYARTGRLLVLHTDDETIYAVEVATDSSHAGYEYDL